MDTQSPRSLRGGVLQVPCTTVLLHLGEQTLKAETKHLHMYLYACTEQRGTLLAKPCILTRPPFPRLRDVTYPITYNRTSPHLLPQRQERNSSPFCTRDLDVVQGLPSKQKYALKNIARVPTRTACTSLSPSSAHHYEARRPQKQQRAWKRLQKSSTNAF